MSPKYSRRGYLPINKPLSNRLRVQTTKSKRKASKRSRPTSPPDHPPRRDHPPRASTRALFRSLRRTFPFDQRGTSQPSTRSLDLTVHSRVRDPAARPPVMKSSSGLWRHGVRTRFDCAITTAGGGCRGCRHSCARRRDVHPHRSMDPSQHRRSREIHHLTDHPPVPPVHDLQESISSQSS